jgi:hypothetical protein
MNITSLKDNYGNILQWRFTSTIENSGNTQANLHVNVGLSHFFPKNTTDEIPRIPPPVDIPNFFDATIPLGPKTKTTTRPFFVDSATVEAMKTLHGASLKAEQLNTSPMIVYLITRIDYKDIFRCWHITRICEMISYPGPLKYIEPTSSPCGGNSNCADGECGSDYRPKSKCTAN